MERHENHGVRGGAACKGGKSPGLGRVAGAGDAALGGRAWFDAGFLVAGVPLVEPAGADGVGIAPGADDPVGGAARGALTGAGVLEG
jgi:hypothetical protein